MPPRRPNVLCIMTDQHHAACLGHAGRAVRTPHLDRLAAEGVRFTQAFCNNPICTPSRLSYLSGRYPQNHGHFDNSLHHLDEPCPQSLAAMARRAGYQTALIGKSHMIGGWDREGFETRRYCGSEGLRDGEPLPGSYAAFLAERNRTDSSEKRPATDAGPAPVHCPHCWIDPAPYAETVEAWTGEATLETLRARDRDRPFFTFMSFQRPHDPYAPSFERADLYRPADVDVPANAIDLWERAFEGKPAYMRAHVEGGGVFPCPAADEADLRLLLSRYYALITLIDEEIGRVLEYLRAEGELENTIVAFVADHGDFAGEHGLVHKNLGIYEAVHRVPFLLRYPGCPAGKAVGALVESVDLHPTLAALTGLEPPGPCDGRSLLPVIEQDAPGKAFVVCEWPAGPSRYAVRTPDYRLVHVAHGERGELYDRRSDPGELENLWEEPSLHAVRQDLLEALFDHVSTFPKKDGAGDFAVRR